MHSAVFGWNINLLSPSGLMHHLMPMFVDFLYGSSVHCCKWGVKLPTIFVLLSISPFKVVSRYLIYCGDPMLGVHIYLQLLYLLLGLLL